MTPKSKIQDSKIYLTMNYFKWTVTQTPYPKFYFTEEEDNGK